MKEVDYKVEFKVYIRKCVDRHYHVTASAIAGMSFYDKEVKNFPLSFGERRALADQHGNIYRAWLHWDYDKKPLRPSLEDYLK